MTTMKTLLLVRHAKSGWDDPSLSDFDRPLNERGKRAAPDMGARLRDRGVHPQLVVSSPARRAMHTAQILATELDYPKTAIEYVDTLYAASAAVWLGIIRGLPAHVDSAMIVGHNPEATEIANKLCPARIDHMPTCAVLELHFEVADWGAIAGVADQYIFDFPKNQHRVGQ